MTAPGEQTGYSFAGPGVAISCEVKYDGGRDCYVATGDAGHIGTADSRHEAALMCFQAWLTNRHAYYKQSE